MPKRQPGKAFLEAQNYIALSIKDRKSFHLNLLQKSLCIEKQNGNALYFYSLCLQERGLVQASKAAYSKAYSLNPCYFSTLKDDRQEIKKSVLRSFADASSMMKSNGQTNDFKWQQVVNMYAKKKDLNTCLLILNLFQKVKKEDKQYSPHLFSTFGITLYEMGRYEQSLQKYITACGLKQNEYRYYNNMAILQYIFCRYEESTQLVAKSLQYNPGYPKSMFILSFSLCKLGRFDEAFQHILNSIKKEPTMTMYRFKALTILAQYLPHNLAHFDEHTKEIDRIVANDEDNDNYFYSNDNQPILRSSIQFLKLHQKFRSACPAEWAQYIQHLDDFLIKGHTDKYHLSLKMKEIQQKLRSSFINTTNLKPEDCERDLNQPNVGSQQQESITG